MKSGERKKIQDPETLSLQQLSLEEPLHNISARNLVRASTFLSPHCTFLRFALPSVRDAHITHCKPDRPGKETDLIYFQSSPEEQ